jgi:hypothetical protein
MDRHYEYDLRLWRTTQVLPYSEELVSRAWVDPIGTFIGLQDAGVVKGMRRNNNPKELIDFELVKSTTSDVLLVHYIEHD